MKEAQQGESFKIGVPDALHFVWLGQPCLLHAHYINLWLQVNSDKECHLWHDAGFSLSPNFHQAIARHVRRIYSENFAQHECTIKNHAFTFIYSRLGGQRSFNSLSKEFLLLRGIIDKNDCYHPASTFPALSKRVVVKDITPLFKNHFSQYYKYYCYEVILRNNLASASDIIRLLVLYQRGGVYIDVDTLPYFDNLFLATNRLLKEKGIQDNHFIGLAKTEAVLVKIGQHNPNKTNNNDYLQYIKNIKNETKKALFACINTDIENINTSTIPSLGPVYAYKNLLALASVRRLEGIYFNSVIAACAGAKALSIILRTLAKRYRFLERNNAIFQSVGKTQNVHYLSRLLPWRDEAHNFYHEVTPALTGPGLILEVLLGLAYEIVNLGGDMPPEEVARLMQNDRYGIAFFEHTLDTPTGLYSSWRTR
ncbi:glycosyl transferase [Enterobacteriaceae bacterium H18W14]|uniref:TcdA/TcdB catalytic glycosyltransferase domain-containing protein n=1 Tax=Dryocola boscaweniae TaxID=2925397 RepID=UPI0022F0BF97|nr:TcdA/TcdB catalytic glycosyltransferase domain-containing protein [Dryocola boscaweniae]MCT4716416.1 glycosyl transferase [Dryocola boscaweniae]